MSYVAYDSTKIIPAPLVTFNNEWQRTEDGSRAGRTLLITLSGKFVSGRGGLYTGSGYPADVDADRHCFKDILAKQSDVTALFDNTDYAWLEIMPDPEATSTPTKYIAKVISIQFPEGRENQWVETTDYIVQLEAQIGDAEDDTEMVTDYDETWELRYNEEPNDTYNLVHTIRCTSKEQYVVALASITEGWKKAYSYVNNDLGGAGIDNSIVQSDPGLALGVSFLAYNHVLTKNLDEYSGVYSIQETWLMSETNYSEDQQIEVRWDRDAKDGLPDTTVTISGTITGLRNDAGTGYANAQTRWATVESGLYAQANAAASGTAIRTTPKSTQVTYDEYDRVINYTYVYDNGSEDYLHDQTRTVSEADNDCNKITVQVSGTVTGIKDTDGGTTAWENAQAAWTTIKAQIPTDAASAYTLYGGTGSLRSATHDKREVYQPQDGIINYTYTYHDWPTAYVHDQSVETAYDKKTDHSTIVVSGSITAWCADGYNEALSYFNTTWTEAQAYTLAATYYSGSSSLSSDATNIRVTYNEFNRVINYSYEFDDYNNLVDVDVSYIVETDPDHCGYNIGRIEGNITGKAGGGKTAWQNALDEYNGTWASADPSLISGYLPGAQFVSKSVTHNEFNNRISFTYQYTDQTNAYSIDETVTRSYTPEDCGYENIVQNGTITGYCDGGVGSAMANAEVGLTTVTPPSGAGSRMRQSVTRNDSRGTIQYNYEYTSRSTPYIIDETVTEQEIIDRKGKTVTYSGTVSGLCTGNPPSSTTKYANAVAGWATHEPTIDPATDFGGAWTRRLRSVGHNEHSGVITYNLEYIQTSLCISGALEESVDITIEEPTDVFAIVAILGGPSIIQDKGGDTVARKTISVTARFEPDASCSLGNEPDVESLIDSAEPSADVVVVERNTKQWNPYTGQYQRVKTWVYANCSS
jgi:hypothetical protein